MSINLRASKYLLYFLSLWYGIQQFRDYSSNWQKMHVTQIPTVELKEKTINWIEIAQVTSADLENKEVPLVSFVINTKRFY